MPPARRQALTTALGRHWRILVDRVDLGTGGADVRLKLEGLASLVRDLATPPADVTRAAA